MQRNDDTLVGIVSALSLHGALVLLFVLSNLLSFSTTQPDNTGEPGTAVAMIRAADIQRMQNSIRESESVQPPRHLPDPKPQSSRTPQQIPEQDINQDNPEQERISKLAIEQTDEKTVAEREARRQQVQIELASDVNKREMAQRNQALQDPQLTDLEVIRFSQKSTDNMISIEDQSLQQFQDMQASDEASASPVLAPNASGGNLNAKNDLLARYKAAIRATIQSNWRFEGVQPLERCQVEFTQELGGEVIDVTFVNCPLSPEGRSSAERAVRLTPLPYYGFEPVFEDRQQFTLCYPTELCGG